MIMSAHSRCALAALSAAILLGLAVSAASAGNYEILNGERGYRIAWRSLEFANNAGLEKIRCPVTIEGSFHSRTVAKVEKALIGHVTRAKVKVESCTGGRVRLYGESLPWQLQYGAFEGTLPNIIAIYTRTVGERFSIEPRHEIPITCIGTTSNARPALTSLALGREAGGLLQIIAAVANGSISMLEGPGICPEITVTLESSSSTVTVLTESATIKIRLIG
jgi:hypothetical protein